MKTGRPRILETGQSWWNVTVRLESPRDEAALRVLMARYRVRSYGAAARMAIRESAGVEVDDGVEGTSGVAEERPGVGGDG